MSKFPKSTFSSSKFFISILSPRTLISDNVCFEFFSVPSAISMSLGVVFLSVSLRLIMFQTLSYWVDYIWLYPSIYLRMRHAIVIWEPWLSLAFGSQWELVVMRGLSHTHFQGPLSFPEKKLQSPGQTVEPWLKIFCLVVGLDCYIGGL